MSEIELTQEFRDKVISGLAKLDTGVEGIKTRLDRVNGSIKELYLRTEINKDNLSKHVADCPLKERVADIDVALASSTHPSSLEVNQKLSDLEKRVDKHFTEKETSAKWWKLLQPVIWAATGTFLGLVVQHADLILKK